MKKIILFLIFFLGCHSAWADITTGLLDYWNLDEGSGTTAADSGSNNVTANLKNTPTWITGKVNNAIQFNGTNQSLQSSATVNLSGTSVITLAFWLWQNAFDNGDELAFESSANYNNTNGAFILDANSSGGPTGCTGGGFFDVGVSAGDTITFNYYRLSRPTAATWHHYVFVIYKSNSNSSLAYVDGVAQTFTQCASNSIAGNFSNSTINFMSRNNASLWNAGKLDEIRIYNRALTASDVTQLYNYGITSTINGATINGATIN